MMNGHYMVIIQCFPMILQSKISAAFSSSHYVPVLTRMARCTGDLTAFLRGQQNLFPVRSTLHYYDYI